MENFFGYIKTHRLYSALIAVLAVAAIVVAGFVIYANGQPDEKAKTEAKAQEEVSSSSTTTSEDTTSTTLPISDSVDSSATTTTKTNSPTTTKTSVSIKSITVTGSSGEATSNSQNASWVFPISAQVTMSSGGNVPLTYTFNLSDNSTKVINSSTGSASTTWTLAHCTNGSFTVTVTGAGKTRTSSTGHATWSGC